MGKNHRHSKKLKSEKNKTHIKSKTKFLPKGQNVTNTSFKIKPIVLQEQLQERQKSTINVEELVTKLKHFNDTVKTDACQDLRDFVMSHSYDSIQVYLSSIVQNASVLIQDRERKVRRASVKLLQIIFEKVPVEALRPFFTYILTNLKCAMTNINKQIQEDSLLLLDAILEHQSVMITESFDDFFPNFLMLISKVKSPSERSLSLNLDGKVTSVKWRVKVLSRLHGVLNTRGHDQDNNYNKNWIDRQVDGTFFIPLYQNIGIYENSDLSNKTVSGDFGTHVSVLTKLLHDIWLEVVPEKTTVLTNEESVAIFICIVRILGTLRPHLRGDSFLDSLINTFPYSHNRKNLEIAKDFPKSFNFHRDQNLVEENLLVVHLYLTLREISSRHKTITNYINKCLKSQSRLTFDSCTNLIKILKTVLLDQPHLCRRLGFDETELAENIVGFYGRVPEGFKSDVLEILTSSRLQKSQSLVRNLPNFLVESRVPAKLIESVSDLCRRGNEGVQVAVKDSLGRILGNLPRVEISDVVDLEKARKSLASVLFYLPDLDVGEVEKFISEHPDSRFTKYFRVIVELRLNVRL